MNQIAHLGRAGNSSGVLAFGRMLLSGGLLLAAAGGAAVEAGWATMTKYLYGPNELVMMDVGSIEFYPADFWGNCTACPPTGQCDDWSGVNISALVYVVRHGAVSGDQRVALQPLKVIPEFQLVQPTSTSGFVDEPVAYTGPDGDLMPGKYDIIFDECEDHYFDPNQDAIAATFAVGYVDIEFMDPYPDLLDGDHVTTDYSRLYNYAPSPECSCQVADGVTRLVLRVADLPEGGSVTFRLLDGNQQTSDDLGELREIGGSDGSAELTVSTTYMLDDTYAAFALWVAPQDFVPAAGGEMSASRSVTVEAEYTPDSGGAVPPGRETGTLYRPPVVLVHGLWSSSGTWQWNLAADPRFLYVHKVEYGNCAAEEFEHNVPFVRKGVESAVTTMRAFGIAATQADVLGHSMGGILSRLYIANVNGQYIRDDNYGAGDIHKLITVDTPHHGSPLASYLVDENNQIRLLGRVFSFLGCMTCGAVHDLRPDSPAITGMPPADAPVHAIVGKGGSDAIELALESLLPRKERIILTVLRFFGVIDDVFPPAYQHDMIVGRLSQEGGLGTGSSATSVVGLDPGISLGLHWTVTKEQYVADIAGDLLVEPIDSDVFADGLPAGAPLLAPPTTIPDYETRDGALTIVSPPDGTVVEPGQSVDVVVAPVGDYEPARVLVVCGTDAQIDEEAPFELTLTIDPNCIGDIELKAYAFDAADVLAESSPVTIIAQPSASLTSLSVLPTAVYLYNYAPSQQLRVIGHFSDGVDRDVTAASTGTVCVSSDECRLSVTPDGLLTANHVGSASVQVTNGDVSRTVWVQIISAPGDFDRDGDVDLADLSVFLAAYDTCAGEAGFNPDADLDGSGCVDLSDLAQLLAVYGDSCP